MEEHQRMSGSVLGSIGTSDGSAIYLELLYAALLDFNLDTFLFFFDESLYLGEQILLWLSSCWF